MIRLLLICCLLLSACASRSERVIALANRGLAYDGHYHPTVGGDPKTLQFLQSRAEWFGIAVAYRPTGHDDLRGAVGISFAIDHQKFVFVNGDLSVNGRLEVLAHEVGHSFQPPMASRMEQEVFAELVSVEACRRLGVDTSKASARYLQADKSALWVARTYRAEIVFVADLLTRGFKTAVR